MSQDVTYINGFSSYVADSWNRFWFEPSKPVDLCFLRIVVGVLALGWQLSYTPSISQWIAAEGWFDSGVYHSWVGDEPGATTGRFSFLFIENSTLLWCLHALSTLVLVAFTLGVATRVSALLAFIVVLSYVHRAPFVNAQPEVVLTFMVGYLCLAPCGAVLSVDARRSSKVRVDASSWSTIARRLIQVHLCAVYLLAFTTKLAAPTWWNGDAMWWYLAQPSVQSVDLTMLQSQALVLNVWTFFSLFCDAIMVSLVWNRWFRPLVLFVSCAYWLLLGIAIGRFAFPLTMITASIAFWGADLFSDWYNRVAGGRVSR